MLIENASLHSIEILLPPEPLFANGAKGQREPIYDTNPRTGEKVQATKPSDPLVLPPGICARPKDLFDRAKDHPSLAMRLSGKRPDGTALDGGYEPKPTIIVRSETDELPKSTNQALQAIDKTVDLDLLRRWNGSATGEVKSAVEKQMLKLESPEEYLRRFPVGKL